MNEKKLNTSIKSKLIAVTSLLLLLCLFGVTYAYFSIQVQGNEEASSVNVGTVRLSLIYTDVQIVMGEYEQPGWTDSKVLTVENNGTDTVSYALKWRELENTLVNGELVISATCTSTSGSCSNIPETGVPYSQTEITNVYVYGPVSIAPGVKHTYTLTAHFKETGSNQNYNQNKYFNGTLNVDVDSANYSNDWEKTYTVTFNANGGSTPTSSKEVAVGFPYGELPTPTRSGYTFKGWNGKNILNIDKVSYYDNWDSELVTSGSYPTTTSNRGYPLDLVPGNTYTISFETESSSSFPPYLYLCRGNNNTGYLVTYLTTNTIVKKSYTFTVEPDYVYFLRMGSTSTYSSFINGIGKLRSLQLELGNTVTAYEPYYIKPETIVVQKQNHTLTAIWE